MLGYLYRKRFGSKIVSTVRKEGDKVDVGLGFIYIYIYIQHAPLPLVILHAMFTY